MSNLVENVLRWHWNGSVPVNPILTAESIGIEVWRNPGIDVDGTHLRNGGVPTIVYRPSGDRRKDKLVIAREIGALLGEVDAEGFSRSLLMPEGVVNWAVRVSDMLSVREIAEYLDMPEDAVRMRLADAGYLDAPVDVEPWPGGTGNL